MHKQSRVYVAGHQGMVGSAVVRALQRDEYRNIITRSRSELDLLRQEDVETFFATERPQHVMLCAAKVGGIIANNEQRADFLYENLQIQTNVISAAHKYGVEKLLFLGSSCIYPKLALQPIREEYLLTGELEPTNEPYAIAKIAGLKLCESYNRQYGTRFISAMPTNMYGPNDNYDLRTSHVLPALIRKFHLATLLASGDLASLHKDIQLHNDTPCHDDDVRGWLQSHGVFPDRVELWGSGTPRREFMHVDDCADAILFMMQQYEGSTPLNVGYGEDVTIRELAETIAGVIGFPGTIVFNSLHPDGTPQKLLDSTRLRSLGWQPHTPLLSGLHRTYGEYQQQV